MPKITSKIPEPKFQRGGKFDFANDNRSPTLTDKNNSAPKRIKLIDFDEKVYFKDVYSRQESDKAIECFFRQDRSQPIWIPKTQIDNDSEVWTDHQHGILVISLWLAEKQKLLSIADK